MIFKKAIKTIIIDECINTLFKNIVKNLFSQSNIPDSFIKLADEFLSRFPEWSTFISKNMYEIYLTYTEIISEFEKDNSSPFDNNELFALSIDISVDVGIGDDEDIPPNYDEDYDEEDYDEDEYL